MNSLNRGQRPRLQIFPCVSKGACHPDEFVQEFVDPPAVCGILHFASGWVEKLSRGAEVNVRENCDQSEFAQHWEQTLDHPRATEWASRHATNSNCFMDVFLQVCIEHMLQETWETMVIFRNDEDKPIGAIDGHREFAVLKSFAGVIHSNGNFPDVDQFGFDVATFCNFAENKVGRGLGQSTLSRRADDDRKKNRSNYFLRSHAPICRTRIANLTMSE